MKKSVKIRVGVVALITAALGGAFAVPALGGIHHVHAHLAPAVTPSH
jgi:hypothetical protein